MIPRVRYLAVILLVAFSLVSGGEANSTQQGSQEEESATTTSAENSLCGGDAEVQVPGAEFQEAECLEDLTTEGTQETGTPIPRTGQGCTQRGLTTPVGCPDSR